MIVSSPLAVAGKIVMTLALVTGVAKLSLSNSTIKNDIVATQANIKTLKQETNAKKQVKLKKKVTTSDYQKAEASGRKVADALNKLMAGNTATPKPINYKDVNAKLVNSKDEDGNHHALLLTFPTILSGYHTQYAHSGASSAGEVLSGFLIYDSQNKLQGILKCSYDPLSGKFGDYKFVPTKALGDALQNANRQLQAQENQKLYGNPKTPNSSSASSSVNKNAGASQDNADKNKPGQKPATQPSKAPANNAKNGGGH